MVPADLIETTPELGGLLQWLLASPMLLFLGWAWVDLFAHFSPVAFYWLDVGIALAVGSVGVVLPLGLAAFRLVTAFPRLFQHAGWDVQPLEPVSEAEQYTVRYDYRARRRAKLGWRRAWLRAAQGWVYLEIVAILLGGILMVPLFFSASDFGFGE
jgi:hypothetical protein